ncbi:MAG: Arc/MetJ-type ribon-helix-helix transcriptional regulator [Candidatus Woesearchaeota archaeon]|jgi:Arc/MetJ-type ribon-helix-helix transcriptional regulator
MTTEMITLKLDSDFLADIDTLVQHQNYQNRTEFIRNVLREKLEKTKMKEALLKLAQFKGSSTRKTSQKEYESVREKIFKELF